MIGAFLSKNALYAVPIAFLFGVASCGAGMWKVMSWKIEAMESSHELALIKQEKMLGEEKTDAVNAKALSEQALCEEEQRISQEASNEFQKGLIASNNRFRNAVLQLLKKTARDDYTAVPDATGGSDAAAPVGRLYYADPAGAFPALDRARICTEQAGQLIGLQVYIDEHTQKQKQ